MTTTDSTDATATQVYRVYIKATPEAIWTAITDPEWTNRYGYTGYTHYEPLEKGGEVWCVPNEEFKAQVRQASGGPVPRPAPRRRGPRGRRAAELVTTWRMLMDPRWRPSRRPRSPTRSRTSATARAADHHP